MGKHLNKIKNKIKKGAEKIEQANSPKSDNVPRVDRKKFKNKKTEKVGDIYDDDIGEEDYPEDVYPDDNIDEDVGGGDGFYDDVGITPAQKPESFHHYILENQYKDLERSIRGVKEVWDKKANKWTTKRKSEHCFTDEEAEDILRTAQSHLATDIKLGRIKKESFGDYMNALYKEVAFLFESIAEYRYGRYNTFHKKTGKLIRVNYKKQYDMKLQNQKIFLELWTRIQANYSRSIGGAENIATHQGVKGQESLHNTDRDHTGNERSYYT